MGNMGRLEGSHPLQGHIGMTLGWFQETVSGQGTSSHPVHTCNDKAF